MRASPVPRQVEAFALLAGHSMVTNDNIKYD